MDTYIGVCSLANMLGRFFYFQLSSVIILQQLDGCSYSTQIRILMCYFQGMFLEVEVISRSLLRRCVWFWGNFELYRKDLIVFHYTQLNLHLLADTHGICCR